MEQATQDLQVTLDAALKYAKLDAPLVGRLRLYVKAINEDIALLDKEKPTSTTTDETKKAAASLIKEARARRREIEHQIEELASLVSSTANSSAATVDTPAAGAEAKPEKVNTGMKLPPIKIPTFKGDESKWQSFIDVFEQIVGQHKELSEIAKLTHLKAALEGKPRELVDDLPDDKNAYKTAVDLLKRTYGGKKKALMRLYQKLHDMQPATGERQSLRWTLAKITGIVKSLQGLEHDPDKNDYVSGLVLGKFPDDIVCKVIEDDDTILLSAALEKLDKLVTARENVHRTVILSASASNTKPNHSNQSNNHRQQQQNQHTQKERAPKAERETPAESERPASSSRGSRTRDRRSERFKPGEPRIRCAFCNASHWPDECDKYVDIESRRARLLDRCELCLKRAHPGERCRNPKECHYCQADDHNRAFCPKRFGAAKEEKVEKVALISGEAPAFTQEEPRSVRRRLPGGGRFLTFILQVYRRNSDQNVRVRAVVDTASSCTIITAPVAEKLGLERERIHARTFKLLGERALKKKTASVTEFNLRPPNGERLDVPAYVVDRILDDLPAADVAEFRALHSDLAQYHIPESGAGEQIDLLLGTDCLAHLLTLDRSVKINGGGQLLSTLYGWLIFAAESGVRRYKNEVTLATRSDTDLKRMWELEALGLKQIEAREVELEEGALRSFYKYVWFNGERYEVAWPWAEYPPPLSEHFGLALGRLRSLYRKLRKMRELLRQYHEIIRQQEADGIVEKVYGQRVPDGRVVHYIPHHPVIMPDKTTKVRIVFDGSAKGSAHERSLNELILKGTNWLSDVVTMLVRFRKNKLAVVADITKAFHQLAVREQDRDAVRFLWLKDPFKEPTMDNLQVYRFKRVAFGVVASPFLLSAVIHHHLQKESAEDAKRIGHHMYADNFMLSAPSGTNMPQIYRDTKGVFERMGMQLTKWATNDPVTRAAVKKGDEEPGARLAVLGLEWRTLVDTFSLRKPRNEDLRGAATKRKVLKQMAALFDPLGFAAPVIISARMFLRKLWHDGFTWDKPLDEKSSERWSELVRALQDAAEIELPRRIAELDVDAPEVQVQMHAFTDASQEAYAVVVYLRLVSGDSVAVGMVAAKNRLAPKGALSIPRLELLAMLVGSRFTKFLRTALDVEKPVETHIWCDSQCALAWVASQKLLPAAIEKQVREIRANEIHEFHYVPTKENPADVATRGATVSELRAQKWWDGPGWLRDEQLWPSATAERIEESRLNPTADEFVLATDGGDAADAAQPAPIRPPFFIDINKFSQLRILLRRTAYCIEALCRYYKRRLFGAKAPLDYGLALRIWIRWDQRQAQCRGVMPKLKDVSVYMGPDGIMRARSRMQHAALGEQSKEPILLVPGSYLTELIVVNAHEMNCHAGTSHTLAALRRAYWLPSGRRAVYGILSKKCFGCRAEKARSYAAPRMPPLPHFRVDDEQLPFAATGMDVFGPLKIRRIESGEKGKAWVLLFTCLRTRAIHLEPMWDMTTQEFLLSFRKFVARRNVPRDILTDNAPQFHVINGRFSAIWQTLEKDPATAEYFAERQIHWYFVPPHAPWFGGAYERLVGSTKLALERTYGDISFQQRQLDVILTEVEAMLNARPITYVDRELESPIITPALFLQARFTALPLDFSKLDASDAAQPVWAFWKSAEEKLNQFWKHWSRFYLAELRERRDSVAKKYREEHREPTVGEIVLVAEPERKRALWRKAVIERLQRSADGCVRTVQIKFANGTRALRPVVELVPLELTMELPEEAARPLNRQLTGIVQAEHEGVIQDRVSKSVRVLDAESYDEPVIVELGIDDTDHDEAGGWEKDLKQKKELQLKSQQNT
ncbi:hypothetical protein V9T40_002295 [Parthenolecanium corni]|uniref:Integrase catalytic domain-containing protein n=1 Tax=Parthenolecanium corni TaxID=536013 RepID=A0AAN9TU99_9HEMI